MPGLFALMKNHLLPLLVRSLVVAVFSFASVSADSLEQLATTAFVRDLDPDIIDRERTALFAKDDPLQPPRWDHLFRFALDVTGDGRDEIFVSMSEEETATSWNVYQETDSGIRLLGKNLRLRPGNIAIQRTAGGAATLNAHERFADLEWGLVSYQFNTDGNFQDSSRKLDEIEKLKLRRGLLLGELGLDQPMSAPTEMIPLSVFLNAPAAPWSPYNLDRSPMSQADSAVIEAGREWVRAHKPAPRRHISEIAKTSDSTPPIDDKVSGRIAGFIAIIGLAILGLWQAKRARRRNCS